MQIVSKDILHFILTFVDSINLLRMRNVNTIFKTMCEKIVNSRAFCVDSDRKLDQLFEFAYKCNIFLNYLLFLKK